MIDLKLNIPEGFLEEEERSGYLVSKEMKEIWAVELDLLAEFQRVCKKHNIKYFPNGGTFLGAIRHQGFIPWDDDIDISMLREDYDKLCEVAPTEFKHPYFWQTEYTDKGSLRGHAQLRNSNTTGILKSEFKKKRPFNQGIFIDIFPFDSVVEDKELYEEQHLRADALRKKARRLARITDLFKISNYKFPKNILYFFPHVFYKYIIRVDYDKIYKEYEEECSKYNEQKTEFISQLSFGFEPLFHQYREDYEDFDIVPFEFMEIAVPKNADRALTKRFGNYKEFVKGGAYHGGVIFDTDRSYLKYFEEEIE